MKKANYVISVIICAIAITFLAIGKSYTFTLDGITTASSVYQATPASFRQYADS